MSINFPGTIDVFVNPSGTSTLNDPDHSLQHSDANDAIEAIEAVIGTTAGTSVLKDFSAGEFAVRQEGGTVSPGTLTINDAILGSPTLTSPLYQGLIDGWVSANETWTYASSTTFTVASDVTDKYQKGDKIKFTQATDGVKYMYIVGVSESGGTTTITVTGGSDYDLDNEAITANYYSHASNPIGFPDWFEYTATITAGVGSITTAAETSYFSIKEKTVFVRNIIVTTTNGTGSDSVRFSLPVTAHASLSCGGGGRSLQNGDSISVTLSSTTVAAYYTYNNAYPGGDGYTMQGGLFYQMA
jgi:hypothetical protein